MDSLLRELRKRRLVVFKERDNRRRKDKQRLSKKEMALWESEKRLTKSQKKMTQYELKLKEATDEYKKELRHFIESTVKLNFSKRKK